MNSNDASRPAAPGTTDPDPADPARERTAAEPREHDDKEAYRELPANVIYGGQSEVATDKAPDPTRPGQD